MGEYAQRSGNRSQLEAQIVRGGINGVFAWGMMAVQKAQEYAPVDTARLVRSINLDDVKPSGPQELEQLVFTILFGTNVEYARAHELGSGIHSLDPAERELILIEPGFYTGESDKKALSFFWPAGPKPHSALQTEGDYAGKYAFRRVWHPGVKPAQEGQGYLRKGAHDTKKTGLRAIVVSITAEMRKSR
ncbi:hypothetical protein LCGC14_1206480 [marine sediment metagenome]|uniref:Uncharacterized protein n=1 Tax=marine sediment metagenome TaxID=412755 RepID=A0A0F9PK14_9ZZZZ